MRKQIGKNYFFKKMALISWLLLILEMSLGGWFFITPTLNNEAQAGGHNTMCAQPVDVVLLTDRSGSMDYTSRCDWWQLKCVNPPSCSAGYNWLQNTTYNQTQAWCTAKNKSAPHQSVYQAINPKKIVAAKQAANNFVDLMGLGDQSALVSYANTASLDKLLSNNHAATETAINNLVANGATDIGDAIKLGSGELLSSRANTQAVKAMILLTDGLANKPYGPGYGEYPADVAYALAKAAEAAAAGIRIFTIGLGAAGEINETMLQSMAANSGGQYYHAPTQNDLQAIYNSIATRLCQFGSISGCKYSDANQDGLITGEEKISGWEIILKNNDTLTQLTDAGGCFKFTGLLPGGYVLSEGGKTGVIYEQTYPPSGIYAINLNEGLNLENYDFGNYLPVCGNQFVDTSYGEICELGQTQVCYTADDYEGKQSCQAGCKSWGDCRPEEFCGDGVKNGPEQCDGAAGVGPHQTCSQTCTLNNSPYCGDGVKNGTEECDGAAGVGPNQICSANCVLTNLTYCGDGIKNGFEQCDDGNANNNDGCKNNCRLPGCQSDVDLMMVLDRSGSMGYSSTCDWWQLKCLNPPSCSLGYNWVNNITYNQTASWCNAKNQSAPHQAVFQAIDPVKITAAKDAANNFLNLMGEYDQSGLVSYANDATLDKLLSNNHVATKIAINSLITNGATNIGDGIKLGAGELLSVRVNPQANKVIILLTDGLANKPNGPGYGEDPADVAYALAQAGIAANAGIKVFTIGLGSDGDINETMLQSMAVSSGGQYYHAPTASQLEEIFGQIVDDSCPNYVCGNGLTEPGETCDDGADNGKFNYCNLDCTGQTPAVCGNGRQEGTETCDDGNTQNGDGCSSVCQEEGGGGSPVCGNGSVESGETCDDGNTVNGDDCSSTCQIESAAIIKAYKVICQNEANLPNWGDGASGPAVITPEAVNNFVSQSQGACTLAENWEFEYSANPVSIPAGNYYGPAPAGSGWSAFNASTGSGDSPAEIAINNYGANIHVRENLKSNYTPFSDNLANNTSAEIYCHDDIYIYDNDDLVQNIQAGQTYYCVAFNALEIPLSICGNGRQEGTETCDDGNTVNGDGCSSVCQEEGGGGSPICGNGSVESGETCDDGINNGQFGYCKSDCTGPTLAVCGNGRQEGTETCDDGNTVNGDGCDSACQIETTAVQPGQVVINELMWPGTSSSTADEWLELRNLTTGQLDLSNCQLTKKSFGLETLMLAIPAGKTIATNGYFVISNYDKDHSHLNIDPNLVETDVSLANSDLQIKLYCGGAWNSGGTLVDTADDGDDAPLAGSNSLPKKSMQRKSIPGDGTLKNNWCTAETQVNWDDKVTNLGTPGALNDCN